MKISVITCTYNSSCTIRRCCESLYAQSYNDFEHLIIDNNSSDDTLTIINSFQDKRTKIFSGKDNGIYHAFNKGLELSSGKIIVFLHSDDWLLSDQIFRDIVHIFARDDGIDMVSCGTKFFNAGGDCIRVWRPSNFSRIKLMLGWMPPHTGVFVTSRAFKHVGNFDPSYRISGDYHWLVRFFQQDMCAVFLETISVGMLAGGASNGSMQKFYDKLKEDWKISKERKLFLLSPFGKRVMKLPQFLDSKGRKR